MVDVHKFDVPPHARYTLSDGRSVCLHCCMSLEPTNDKVRTFISKEVLILAEVNSRLPQLMESAVEYSCDRTLGACSKKRPDMVWDFATVVLWLEINEYQHQTYPPQCEIDRRHQIWEDLDCRPTVLIELNPDEYTDPLGRFDLAWTRISLPSGFSFDSAANMEFYM
jgi:hypothetical protein